MTGACPCLGVEAAPGGGDAESGFGMDVGGGLSYAHAGLGLSLGLTGRALVLHCGSTWWPPAASPLAPRPSTRSPSSRR